MRISVILMAVFWGGSASADPGHLIGLGGGHDHLIALGAIGAAIAEAISPPTITIDIASLPTGAMPLEMTRISQGTFLMGSPFQPGFSKYRFIYFFVE